MDEIELAAIIKAEMARIAGDVTAGFTASKAKMAELNARLVDVEQRAARKGGPGNDEPLNSGKSLGDAAEPLVLGLKSANSARTQIALGLKSLSSTAPGAAGTAQINVPIQSLAPVSTYTSPAVRLLDLLPSEPVETNMLAYVRVSYGVAAVGNKAAKVAELTAKPESTVTTEYIQTEIPTWAHFVNASRQVLSDVPSLRSLVDSLLTRGLLDKVDVAIFAELITAGNFTAFAGVVGETIGDSVARIAAQVVNAGGANVIVGLNPTDWLSMSLAKAAGGGTYLGLPPNLASRVAAVGSVTAGTIIAFSPTTGAAFGDRQSVHVEAGYTGDGFTLNRTTLLAEARGAAFVRDPALVAYGALPAAA